MWLIIAPISSTAADTCFAKEFEMYLILHENISVNPQKCYAYLISPKKLTVKFPHLHFVSYVFILLTVSFLSLESYKISFPRSITLFERSITLSTVSLIFLDIMLIPVVNSPLISFICPVSHSIFTYLIMPSKFISKISRNSLHCFIMVHYFTCKFTFLNITTEFGILFTVSLRCSLVSFFRSIIFLLHFSGFQDVGMNCI